MTHAQRYWKALIEFLRLMGGTEGQINVAIASAKAVESKPDSKWVSKDISPEEEAFKEAERTTRKNGPFPLDFVREAVDIDEETRERRLQWFREYLNAFLDYSHLFGDLVTPDWEDDILEKISDLDEPSSRYYRSCVARNTDLRGNPIDYAMGELAEAAKERESSVIDAMEMSFKREPDEISEGVETRGDSEEDRLQWFREYYQAIIDYAHLFKPATVNVKDYQRYIRELEIPKSTFRADCLRLSVKRFSAPIEAAMEFLQRLDARSDDTFEPKFKREPHGITEAAKPKDDSKEGRVAWHKKFLQTIVDYAYLYPGFETKGYEGQLEEIDDPRSFTYREVRGSSILGYGDPVETAFEEMRDFERDDTLFSVPFKREDEDDEFDESLLREARQTPEQKATNLAWWKRYFEKQLEMIELFTDHPRVDVLRRKIENGLNVVSGRDKESPSWVTYTQYSVASYRPPEDAAIVDLMDDMKDYGVGWNPGTFQREFQDDLDLDESLLRETEDDESPAQRYWKALAYFIRLMGGPESEAISAEKNHESVIAANDWTDDEFGASMEDLAFDVAQKLVKDYDKNQNNIKYVMFKREAFDRRAYKPTPRQQANLRWWKEYLTAIVQYRELMGLDTREDKENLAQIEYPESAAFETYANTDLRNGTDPAQLGAMVALAKRDNENEWLGFDYEEIGRENDEEIDESLLRESEKEEKEEKILQWWLKFWTCIDKNADLFQHSKDIEKYDAKEMIRLLKDPTSWYRKNLVDNVPIEITFNDPEERAFQRMIDGARIASKSTGNTLTNPNFEREWGRELDESLLRESEEPKGVQWWKKYYQTCFDCAKLIGIDQSHYRGILRRLDDPESEVYKISSVSEKEVLESDPVQIAYEDMFSLKREVENWTSQDEFPREKEDDLNLDESANGVEGQPMGADGFEVQNQGVTRRAPGESPDSSGGETVTESSMDDPTRPSQKQVDEAFKKLREFMARVKEYMELMGADEKAIDAWKADLESNEHYLKYRWNAYWAKEIEAKTEEDAFHLAEELIEISREDEFDANDVKMRREGRVVKEASMNEISALRRKWRDVQTKATQYLRLMQADEEVFEAFFNYCSVIDDNLYDGMGSVMRQVDDISEESGDIYEMAKEFIERHQGSAPEKFWSSMTARTREE